MDCLFRFRCIAESQTIQNRIVGLIQLFRSNCGRVNYSALPIPSSSAHCREVRDGGSEGCLFKVESVH